MRRLNLILKNKEMIAFNQHLLETDGFIDEINKQGFHLI
jgi:hypothetical protein